jgi:serine/threonine protein kinase
LKIARDSEGRKILNSYLVLQTLDTGSSGKVKLAIDLQSREYFAIKKYNKVLLQKKKLGLQRNEYENVLREIRILQRLKHPNIVQLYEVINDEEDDYIYLVMEYLSGGSILSKQQKLLCLDEKTALNYFVDISCGLEYLHMNHVIHRDIKPDNIVLTGDGKTAKICDFSVSHVFEDNDDRLSSSAGAPAFLAPELVSVRGQSHGKPTDIWALGVTLYYFVFGTCPFLGPSVPAIYEQIQNQVLVLPALLPNGKAPSLPLQDLLHRLLTKDPKRRIAMKDIRRHPWCSELFAKRPPLEVPSTPVGGYPAPKKAPRRVPGSSVANIKVNHNNGAALSKSVN